MLKVYTLIFLFFVHACGQKKSTNSQLSQGNEKKIEPFFYFKKFTPQEVTLEIPSDSIAMSQDIALKMLINSCSEIKADYLNFILDLYGTTSPEIEERFIESEAQHLGKFIVWRYIHEDYDCFSDFFNAYSTIQIKNSDPETGRVILNEIFRAIYLEAAQHDMNYFTGFNEWMPLNTRESWSSAILAWEGTI